MKIGFDNDKYLALQAQHIRARREQFGDKLYIEFGGKLFDDYHASRVLPGFQPDSKIRMLASIRDEVEIVVAICAGDIEKKKIRGDLGIGYDEDVLRLMDVFRGLGFYVGSVVITQYAGQPAADAFIKRLTALGVRSYRHYPIAGYPSDVAHIVSDDGLGKNDYIETTRPIVVVTAPGPGSGKMATCLSQLYHENKRGVRAGYAKYETFPIWNLPLKHPVNLAYEAATADLNDVNMIDPFHLEAYGKTTVNYNRDVEIFPVLNAMFQRIQGTSPYQSPTDMGVNMAGFAIVDDAVCQEASRMEILRRYYAGMVDRVRGKCDDDVVRKLEIIKAAALCRAQKCHGPALPCQLVGQVGNQPAADAPPAQLRQGFPHCHIGFAVGHGISPHSAHRAACCILQSQHTGKAVGQRGTGFGIIAVLPFRFLREKLGCQAQDRWAAIQHIALRFLRQRQTILRWHTIQEQRLPRCSGQ